MKLFLTCFLVFIAFAFAEELEFKRTAETDKKNRFESTGLTSNDDIQKRGVCIDRCESGYVQSKYCTNAAKHCFRHGQVVHVNFNSPFRAPPKVMIGLTLVDTHKDQNVRVRVLVESVTTHGFNIRFRPWDVSITYQLGVNWMACP